MDLRGSINTDETIPTVGGGSNANNGTGGELGIPSTVPHHYVFSSAAAAASCKRDFPISDPFSPQPPPHRNGPSAIAAQADRERERERPASPNPSPRPVARYRECLRNHAASVGGLVVDGCGEFLPAEPDPLKCTVCGCHRSFHRREAEPGEAVLRAHPPPPQSYYYHPYSLSNGSGRRGLSGGRLQSGAPPPLLALPPPHSRPQPLKPSPIMAFRGGVGGNESSGGAGATDTDSSSEEMEAHTPVTPVPPHPPPWPQPPQFTSASSSRKRFRTKFTSEQKERMLEFAGALGWRMQRRDEGAVERFCAEVGVPRKVFKVWMHNNKHASSRPLLQQQLHQPPPPAPSQQNDTYTLPPPPQPHHSDPYTRPQPPPSPP